MTDAEDQNNLPPLLCILHDSDTDLGRMVLRKRWSLALERDVFEMTMDGNLMMSSAVVESESALAQWALAMLPDQWLRVLVGGLGFGFTVQSALAYPQVEEVTVVERVPQVIQWHQDGLLPWSAQFFHDRRLQVVNDDFFVFAARGTESRYDAVLIDIDDSPSLLWHVDHQSFYGLSGLKAVHKLLRPGGVLGMWFATHPGEAFLEATTAIFATMELVPISFENPSLHQPETNYILLARSSSETAEDGIPQANPLNDRPSE